LAAKDTKIGLVPKGSTQTLKMSAIREGYFYYSATVLINSAKQYVSFALIANQAFDIFLQTESDRLFQLTKDLSSIYCYCKL
jgi:hypothetical protein